MEEVEELLDFLEKRASTCVDPHESVRALSKNLSVKIDRSNVTEGADIVVVSLDSQLYDNAVVYHTEGGYVSEKNAKSVFCIERKNIGKNQSCSAVFKVKAGQFVTAYLGGVYIPLMSNLQKEEKN